MARRVRRIKSGSRRSATLIVVTLALAMAGCTATASGVTPPAKKSSSSVKTISLWSPTYRPTAQPGTTDDYHCNLLNPHIAKNSYVISSQFFPGSPEDHHAGLFLVPPSLAAAARQANVGGKGWTCFGEAGLPNEPINEIGSTPFLSVWAPGHGADDLPRGTGIELPAGSMVIMQVHYNLLVGDKRVRNRLVLHTVPTSAPLLPLKLDLSFAAPDLPCPAGVTGPLCDRASSLAHQGQEFGPSAITFVNAIEAACGRNPSDPPAGDSTSCTFPASASGYIVRAQAHMHLLGQSFKLVLNPGTPQAVTVLNVPDYNFHYQKAYNLTPGTGDGWREAPSHVHLRSDLGPGTADPAQGPAPLRHLGRRLIGRDVPWTFVDLGHPAQRPRCTLTTRGTAGSGR